MAAPTTTTLHTTPTTTPHTTTSTTSTSPQHVVVHPLVLLSVVDHYTRTASNKRVVGVLLGQSVNGHVNVANSFAVPFEEDANNPQVWFLDHNYCEAMFDMFRKVNAKERMVGWYHSGPTLHQSDLEINQLFTKYSLNPVLVVINVHPSAHMPTDAYYAVEEVHNVLQLTQDGTQTTRTFNHIASSIEAEEAEEIGVEHLLRDIKDTSVGSLSSQITDQLVSLKGLDHNISEIRKYLDKVLSGSLPVNHQIIYNLQNMFNLLPNLESPTTVASFAVKTNDELLVIYLSSLIRAVIALANLIDNKVSLRGKEDQENLAVEKQEVVQDVPAK